MSVSMCQCALACYHMQHTKRPGSGGPYLSADLHLLHVTVLSPKRLEYSHVVHTGHYQNDMYETLQCLAHLQGRPDEVRVIVLED